MMRVFITSTPEELEPHQAAAVKVTRELGLEPVLRNPAGVRGLKPVPACIRQVATTDLVLSLVGHRRGAVPAPDLGGDGFHPWTWWETRAALDRRLPVAVLMASEAWRPELREEDVRGGSIMRDFRGELQRLAVPFEDDADAFRELVRRELAATQREASASAVVNVELRRWPAPELPDHPYPVLLPYTHPDLLGGRDRELEELGRVLAQPVPIVGLHAPSGSGKSSLLYGGLVPRWRAAGRPVAFDRHLCDPGLAGRLLGDLLDTEIEPSDDPRAFVDRLRAVYRAAEAPPILILDQFEDLLRREAAVRARVVVGTLLAASVQRLPGLHEAPCRWILAYRQEVHGKVVQWLGDVLRDAAVLDLPAAATLPHDLTGADRFQTWPLAPLGTPPPGSRDVVGDASRAFLEAITKPLEHYPLRFAPGLAERLARAFGEARARSPRAPLGPELQVILAHVLAAAVTASPPDEADRTVVIEVPDDPGALIEVALEEHLRRALDAAFPGERHRVGRTRALLALRQLADSSGRRADGQHVDALALAIGPGGHEVLEQLSTAATRVVVAQQQGDVRLYLLSHDRMAEVVVRLFDEGRVATLGVDEELLGLRRFVGLHSELYAAGETEQATTVPRGRLRRIQENSDALLWSDEQRDWFAACRERRRRDRRRRWIYRATAALVVILIALAAWRTTSGRAELQALRDEIVQGDPATAFAALERLVAAGQTHDDVLRALLGQRSSPADLLERGVGGIPEESRGQAVVHLAELLLRSFEAHPDVGSQARFLGPLLWALDAFARDPAVAERARALREVALRDLRRRHPPPPQPAAGDPLWADIPAGSFAMGTAGRPVTVSAFRIMVREVSFEDFRRLVPAWKPGWRDELPVSSVNWRLAYTYAAWLGGRLPTEAEWEYAARAGCSFPYCKRDGSEATAGEAGRWIGNAFEEEVGGFAPAPGMQYEPNPWGLYDMDGNLMEWTADIFGELSDEPAVDPVGPSQSTSDFRVAKGSYFLSDAWVLSHTPAVEVRSPIVIGAPWAGLGFRVVMTAEPSP